MGETKTGVPGVSNVASVITKNRFLMASCGNEESNGQCNDCKIHPDYDVCGSYTVYKERPEYNGRKAYKHQTDNCCLFYSGHNWRFNLCENDWTKGVFFSSNTETNCVHSDKLTWRPYETDSTMDVSCIKRNK